MGLPTYCLVVTMTEKVSRITEEMHLKHTIAKSVLYRDRLNIPVVRSIFRNLLVY